MGRIMFAAVAAFTISACSSAVDQTASVSRPLARTILRVQNHNFNDVTVYLVRGFDRTRLGRVGAMQRGDFVVPAAYVAASPEIRVQADPIGLGQGFVSQPLQVTPGSHMELTVTTVMQNSIYTIYRR